jgi:hypothetical protein
VRSILRFVFVVVPTAALAAAVVIGVSAKDQRVSTFDGDLQQDLKLASTASIELAPAGQPRTTVSAIEASPSPAAVRTVPAKQSPRGSARSVRQRTRAATVASARKVAESVDEPEAATAIELAATPEESETLSPADGGVALPRPTAIPVSLPTGADAGIYDPESVIRGGAIDPDHCQIHSGRGRPVYRPPVYRQPRGISLGDRIRAAQAGGGSRTPSLGDRIRGSSTSARSSIGTRVREASSSRPRSEGSGRTLGDRVRAARGR